MLPATSGLGHIAADVLAALDTTRQMLDGGCRAGNLINSAGSASRAVAGLAMISCPG